MIGISNEPLSVLLNFIEDQGISFPVLHDTKGVYGRFGTPGAASPYPRDFIVDAEGIVRLAKDEYDPGAMIKIIESLLRQPTSIAEYESGRGKFPENSLLVKAYPNPFNPDFNLELKLERPTELTAALYDISGRRIATLFKSKPFAEGFHHIGVDGSGMESGIHFIQVKGPSVQTIVKILKVQ